MNTNSPTSQFSLSNQTDASQDGSLQPLQIHHLSHDLRGPLNAVLGFAELLLDGIEGPLNEMQIEDVAAMQQSAQNLLQLIDCVVDLGKSEAQALTLEMTHDFVLAEVLQNGLNQAHAMESVTVDLPADFPRLQAAPARLAQIVAILTQYLRSKDGETPIIITAAAHQKQAIISVTAPALVIEQHKLTHLFEPLVEVEPSGRSKLAEGGVHLPLAYNLARLQQGDLIVASSPAQGTRFDLTLLMAAD